VISTLESTLPSFSGAAFVYSVPDGLVRKRQY